jgi:hypothetical protein
MRRNVQIPIAVILSGLLSGCATVTSVPFGLLYSNVRSPRAYRSATPEDVQAVKTDPIVTGQSCSRSLLYLVAWGDHGYARTTQNALKDDPHAILYDVRIDTRFRIVLLGLYSDTCTILTGRLGQP